METSHALIKRTPTSMREVDVLYMINYCPVGGTSRVNSDCGVTGF